MVWSAASRSFFSGRNATHVCCATVVGKCACVYGTIGWWRAGWGGSFRDVPIGEPLIQLFPWATSTLIKSLALKIRLKEEALTREGHPKNSYFWCQAGNMKAVPKLTKRKIQEICKYDSEYVSFGILQPIFFLNAVVVCSGWASHKLLEVAKPVTAVIGFDSV